MALPWPTESSPQGDRPALLQTLPDPAGTEERWPRWLRGALALLPLCLTLLLRLPNLSSNPGWDADEGYNLSTAVNLLHGAHRYYALDITYVHHPPFYFALSAAAIALFGARVLALRLVAVACSAVVVLVLPPLAQELGLSRRTGWLAALVYALWPFAVEQTRFGYTYNALALWGLLCLYTLLRYRASRQQKFLVLSGLLAAAALTTDQEALYLLPLLFFAVPGGWRSRLVVLLIALSGPALYLAVMAWNDWAGLQFDLLHTAGRVTQGSILWQAAVWIYSAADLCRIDPGVLLGLAGLLLLPVSAGRRRLLLALVALMLLIILKVRDPNPNFRTAEPLLPLLSLGLGAVLGQLVDLGERRQLPRLLWPACAVAGIVLGLGLGLPSALAGYRTPIDGTLPRSTVGAEKLAAWLNPQVHPRDLVLAMPQISWLFTARTADLLQATAITGRESGFYPAGIASARWAYDVHLQAARYLVIDDFSRAMLITGSYERTLMDQAMHSWPLVYTQGEYRVYRNPRVVTKVYHA